MVLTVKVGQAVNIGDSAVVKILEKSGQRVKMVIATQMAPITLLADGIIPPRFCNGITGEPRYVPREALAAVG